jgi:hypothetical protein
VEIVKVDYHTGVPSPSGIPEVFKPNTAPGEPDAPTGDLGGSPFAGTTPPVTPGETGAPTVDPGNGGLY